VWRRRGQGDLAHIGYGRTAGQPEREVEFRDQIAA
jgi:hypothetical protein